MHNSQAFLPRKKSSPPCLPAKRLTDTLLQDNTDQKSCPKVHSNRYYSLYRADYQEIHRVNLPLYNIFHKAEKQIGFDRNYLLMLE